VASSTLALFFSLLCYAALPIIGVALCTSIAEHVCPPFLPVASSEGPALTKAFMRIKEPKVRRRIVDFVKEIAGEAD
jgi:hypothetical protein